MDISRSILSGSRIYEFIMCIAAKEINDGPSRWDKKNFEN